MRMRTVLSAILSVPQIVVVSIVAAIVLVLLIMFICSLVKLSKHAGVKSEIADRNKRFADEKKQMLAEIQAKQQENTLARQAIASNPNQGTCTETEQMQWELIQQGLSEYDARRIAEMDLMQLLLLKKNERLSATFVINAITRRTLMDAEFVRRDDVDEFKVPINETFTSDIENIKTYMTSADESIVHTQSRGADVYSDGKAFAMLSKRDEGFLLKVKCGPYFGQRLTQLYPDAFSKAKFPAGMLWFDVREGCSLELIGLMIQISRNIAKAGY